MCNRATSIMKRPWPTMAVAPGGKNHPVTVNIRAQECEDPWLFFEAKRRLTAEKLRKHCYSELSL